MNFKYQPHLCGKELLVVDVKETRGKEGKQPSTKSAIATACTCTIFYYLTLRQGACNAKWVSKSIIIVINLVNWIEANLVVNFGQHNYDDAVESTLVTKCVCSLNKLVYFVW